MKHNHPFTIGEKVWDDNTCQWATVSMFGGSEDEGSNFLVLKNDNGELWEALCDDVYQIAPGLRTACSGDIVCYEHNKTEDDYPYYCPELQENFFSIELVQNLQGAILASGKIGIPVFVEDENGRLENITHIWYDPTRHMIRLTVVGVEFNDAEED